MSMEKWQVMQEEILKGVYDICIALVSISDFECCEYGFDEEIQAARKYIQKYEEDRKGV